MFSKAAVGTAVVAALMVPAGVVFAQNTDDSTPLTTREQTREQTHDCEACPFDGDECQLEAGEQFQNRYTVRVEGEDGHQHNSAVNGPNNNGPTDDNPACEGHGDGTGDGPHARSGPGRG